MSKAGFCFYLSCDVNIQVKIKVVGLQGVLPAFQQDGNQPQQSAQPVALYVEATLTTPEDVLGLETKTTYADAQPTGCAWNEWLTFCVKYRDLPHNTQLAVSVYQRAGDGQGLVLVGGTTMGMFNKKGRLKTGVQKLRIWEGLAPCLTLPSTTPGKVPLLQRGPVGQLEHLLKLYARGDIPQADWLDSLMMQEVTQQQQQDEQEFAKTGSLRMVLDLPRFPHAVLYQQPVVAPTPALKDPTLPDRPSQDSIIALLDPEVGKDNPAELKAQKLARSLARGTVDRDLKPNSEERRRIAAVLKLPPNKPLRKSEKALLWRFRFSLTQDKRALTKFLKCVDFGDVAEANQAAELMRQWAPIDTADALELLSPDFTNEAVRAHAAEVLAAKEDEELLYYLLQLVQALRYEPHHPSRLSKFLIGRAVANPVFAMFLHWYLFTEWEDSSFGPRATAVHGGLLTALQSSPHAEAVVAAIRRQNDMMSQLAYIIKELKTSRVKAARATERLQQMVSESGPCSELTAMRVALPLNPAIMLEGLVPAECSCFKSAQLPLKLSYQVDLRASPWTAPAPPSGISPRGGHHPLSQGAGLVRLGDSMRCIMIYKKGDDLRQDQFILQMISLMDRLLKRESLDLHLKPYRVLPTSSDDGLVEFVPSMPLAKILADHRTIHRYLAQFHPDPNGPFGLAKDVVEKFVRSCAGYCVMTYILGVGDRHLDNLMLTTDGCLFHIDFAYILGNDPKPFPPPMKLCKEMIEAMGGSDSSYYQDFRQLCCEAYNILRSSADLILSLFHLMAGSSIAVIREDPEKALLKIQEKLRLDADDEQAVEWLQQLINESATALMPQFIETTHRWAQYWR